MSYKNKLWIAKIQKRFNCKQNVTTRRYTIMFDNLKKTLLQKPDSEQNSIKKNMVSIIPTYFNII